MTKFSGSRSPAQPSRICGKSLPKIDFTVAAILLFLTMPWLQGQSIPTNNSVQREKSTTSGAVLGLPKEVAAPTGVQAQPSPAIGQTPTLPPIVAWDGKQLTIDADNSILADILEAVRARTGASIEMPSSASVERVFVHLGPGPPREILSSLLYGMPFDYVIEAGDDDPDTLSKIVLTAQGIADDDALIAGAADHHEATIPGNSTVLAGGHRGSGDGRSRPGMRMMPGWAGPGVPSFQAEAEEVLNKQQAASEESAVTPDSAVEQESAVAQEAGGAQDSARVQDSAAPGEAASRQSSTAPDAAENAPGSNASASTANSEDASAVGQAIQSMTQMFEQRRQIQAQQNQTSRQQQSPAD